jgi:hypothetical protein
MSTEKNRKAAAMTHEVIRVPSRIQEKQRIQNAAEMSMAELQESAAALGVDTTGAKSKQDVKDRILAAGSAGPIDANTSPET